MFVLNMDCVEGMRAFPDNHFDSIVTDPPYELGFMGKSWDASGIAYSVEMWREALRVLKPGGHLLAFSGSRTYHRMVCAIEDAGFEVRDQIMWVYGSGFPKSLDVSKAIDKARDDRTEILKVTAWLAARRDEAGKTNKMIDAHFGFSGMAGHWTARPDMKICQCPKWDQWMVLKSFIGFSNDMDAEVWRLNGRKGTPGEAWATADVLAVDVRMNEASGIVSAGRSERVEVERQIKAANSDAARQWQGWGTALKPAHEPICVARKPLIGTVAANVLAHGTGAINVDGCRVGTEGGTRLTQVTKKGDGIYEGGVNTGAFGEIVPGLGRWPANLIHDGSDEVLAAFPNAPGQMADASTSDTQRAGQNVYGAMRRDRGAEPSADSDNDEAVGFKMKPGARRLDAGSAARFFYCAKASKTDRSEGNTHPHGQTHRPDALSSSPGHPARRHRSRPVHRIGQYRQGCRARGFQLHRL